MPTDDTISKDVPQLQHGENSMAKESVLDRIRELDAEKEKLLEEAKATALANANQAVAELIELGFQYRLVEGGTATAPRAPRAATGTRRSGIRDDVLKVVADAGQEGIKKADILEKMGMKGNKGDEGAVSNALSALKGDGKITQAEARNSPYVIA